MIANLSSLAGTFWITFCHVSNIFFDLVNACFIFENVSNSIFFDSSVISSTWKLSEHLKSLISCKNKNIVSLLYFSTVFFLLTMGRTSSSSQSGLRRNLVNVGYNCQNIIRWRKCNQLFRENRINLPMFGTHFSYNLRFYFLSSSEFLWSDTCSWTFLLFEDSKIRR